MSPAQNRFERHPALTLWAVILLAVGAADVAVTRLFRKAEAVRDDSYRVRHPVYHHGLAPLRSVPTRWGPLAYRVVTSSLGFRDAEARVVALRSERRRLLVLGDSFAEGIGIDYEDTFVGRMASALRPQGIEILNGGVASYSPIIYLVQTRQLIEEVGLRFDEAIVCLDVSDIPDETVYGLDAAGHVVSRYDDDERAAPQRQAPAAPGGSWIETNTTLLRAFDRAITWRRDRGTDRAPEDRWAIGQETGLWTVDPGLFEKKRAAAGLERAQEHMDALASLLASRGIPLSVVVYPWPVQVYRRDLDSIQVRTWRVFCERRGVRFVDLFPLFIGAEDAAAVLDRDYIAGDVHWTKEGHLRVAEALLAALRKPKAP